MSRFTLRDRLPEDVRRVRVQRLAVALLGAELCIGIGADARGGEKPTVHTVVIQGVKFEPETVTIKMGEAVVWVNKDPFPHTATAAGLFDSRAIAPGGTWRYIARKAGERAYTCTLHPNMKATLRVVAPDRQ